MQGTRANGTDSNTSSGQFLQESLALRGGQELVLVRGALADGIDDKQRPIGFCSRARVDQLEFRDRLLRILRART